MRLFTALGIYFYAALIILLGLILILFSADILGVGDLINTINNISYTPNLRIIIGLLGVLLILISISFANVILGKFQREKTIAFTTPSGEVTIALQAVEDLIKRMGNLIYEIKDLKPNVVATKKGIIVNIRIVLKSEANIPELTARLQDITKSKLQEVLGLEEEIIIKIHVAKIISAEEKEKLSTEPKNREPNIPFSGYGRV